MTKNLLDDFRREHQRRYGYGHANREIELVTLRLRATITIKEAQAFASNEGSIIADRLGRKTASRNQVWFEGKRLATQLLARDELRPGKNYKGPAIITEYSATTVIPPGKQF